MTQLIGQNCVRCRERILSDLAARICRNCTSAVHDRCARPSGESGCPACGAAGSLSEATSPHQMAESPREAALENAALSPKSATLAFALNFFLPGLGLWYIGRLGLGLVNFVGALLAGVMVIDTMPDRNRVGAALGGATASGLIAMSYARQRNALSRANSKTLPVSSDEDEDWSDR